MLKPTSRRDFLKHTAAGVTAWTLGDSFFRPSETALAAASGCVVGVFATSPAQKIAKAPLYRWVKAAGSGDDSTIFIDPEQKYQTINGFGGAFTDAACYDLSQMPQVERAKLMNELFHPSQLGLSVCRTCIGSSDYSRNVYSFDEGDPDPALKRFSIEHDRAYILPMLKEARAVNPDLFLFSSPWSPPGWMKSNKSMLGGNMQRQYMSSYANYFARFLKDYEAAGVPIQAVTVQNEVDTDQDSRMPACSWPQEYEADFVRQFLGPTLAKEGLNTKIWIIDHNYNLWGRALGMLETPDLLKYCNGIAWHGYVGNPEWLARVHKSFPDVDMFWTEGGPDYTDPNYLTDWAKWGTSFTGILRNWCKSITAWNIALDEQGKPNIGPFPCGGIVTIDSKTKAVTRSGQYWALAHFSKFVRRGATVIASTAKSSDIQHVAFENPDGGFIAVLTNPGEARTVSIRHCNSETKVPLSTNSITTVAWEIGNLVD